MSLSSNCISNISNCNYVEFLHLPQCNTVQHLPFCCLGWRHPVPVLLACEGRGRPAAGTDRPRGLGRRAAAAGQVATSPIPLLYICLMLSSEHIFVCLMLSSEHIFVCLMLWSEHIFVLIYLFLIEYTYFCSNTPIFVWIHLFLFGYTYFCLLWNRGLPWFMFLLFLVKKPSGILFFGPNNKIIFRNKIIFWKVS